TPAPQCGTAAADRRAFREQLRMDRGIPGAFPESLRRRCACGTENAAAATRRAEKPARGNDLRGAPRSVASGARRGGFSGRTSARLRLELRAGLARLRATGVAEFR